MDVQGHSLIQNGRVAVNLGCETEILSWKTFNEILGCCYSSLSESLWTDAYGEKPESPGSRSRHGMDFFHYIAALEK